MVSKSIDEGLLHRIQTFVAHDINSRMLHADDKEGPLTVHPDEVYILAFSRILNNWQAVATIHDQCVGYYQLSHDGSIGETIFGVYRKERTGEAIV